MKLCKASLLTIVCLCLTQMMSFGAGKVLLIVQERSEDMNMMIVREANPIMNALKDAGYEVDIATETGNVLGKGTSVLHPNIKLSDVEVNEYVGVVIPCMAVPGPPFYAPKLAIEIVKQMYAKGLPIAAQGGGVDVLIKAGILAGKKYASILVYDPKGNDVGSGVVQDGQILTSGICPNLARLGLGKDGTEELMTEFVKMLKSSK